MAGELLEMLQGRNRRRQPLPFATARQDELARVPYDQREGSGGGGHADLLKLLQGVYEFSPAADVGDVAQAAQDPSLMNVGIAGLAMLGGPPGDFAKNLLKAKKAAKLQETIKQKSKDTVAMSKSLWKKKPLNTLTQGEFSKHYNVHYDLRPDPESRIDGMMQGIKSGMATPEYPRYPSLPDRAPAQGWARWAGEDKKGAIAYVVRKEDVNPRSGRMKGGTVPVAAVRLDKDKQSVFDAIKAGNTLPE